VIVCSTAVAIAPEATAAFVGYVIHVDLTLPDPDVEQFRRWPAVLEHGDGDRLRGGGGTV
jgi:hypothetical protein